MRYFSLGTIACAMFLASAPAAACLSVQSQRTVYPLTDEAPAEGALGQVFKVQYDGQRAGREDRLWPNYYVVDILEGPGAGGKALIPAHVTSCHSVSIPTGKSGYIVATLEPSQKDGDTGGLPILRIGLSGRIESSIPEFDSKPASPES